MKAGIIVQWVLAGFLWNLAINEAGAHAGGHGGLQWPALNELGELAERGEELIKKEDIAGLRSLAVQIKDVSDKVVTSAMPKKVRNPLAVKLYLEDVESLSQLIVDPATMPETDLKNTITVFHPLVITLMEEAGIPHVHEHSQGLHHGVVAACFDTKGHEVGHIELKLHGDKGDVEAWLTGDDAKRPFDLPLDAALTVRFPSMLGREIELRIRDDRSNVDEDGNPNIRDGKTNYFVFPGNTRADSSWLSGESFEAEVQVLFSADGRQYATKPFELVPHAEDGQEHHHDHNHHDHDHEQHKH